MNIVDILVPAIVLICIDFVYLSSFGGKFVELIERIQYSKFNMNFIGVFGSYLLIVFALYYFIIKEKKSVFDAFVLGVVLYGVFDFTNIALFKKYDLVIALIDTLWGGILLASTTFISYRVLHMIR